LIILASLGNAFSKSSPSVPAPSNSIKPTAASTPASAPKAEVAISVTAEALASAYAANEVAADDKYKEKLVEVTGTIVTIAKDFLNDPYVTLSDGTELSFNNPQCSFSKDRASEVSVLTKGEKVRLQGRVSGAVIGTVMIQRCMVVTP
jgi:hypothetical protein